eukprot:scaffold1173_cov405-Prasinococcus_capsulatus_cf.AAC.12
MTPCAQRRVRPGVLLATSRAGPSYVGCEAGGPSVPFFCVRRTGLCATPRPLLGVLVWFLCFGLGVSSVRSRWLA